MDLQCWIYAAAPAGPEAAISTIRSLREALQPRLTAGTLAGYSAVALLEPDDFADEDIDPALVEPVTHGALPAVYLNLTYDLDRQRPGGPEIESLLAGAGLVHVLTDPAPAG